MKLFNRIALVGAVPTLLLPLLSFSCGKSQGTGAAAPVHVSVYTALEPEEESFLKKEFEAGHPGIILDVVPESTGVITARLLAESAHPQADAIWGVAVTSLLNLDRRNMLEPYAPTGIDQIDPVYHDKRTPPHWVGIDAYMVAFAVNTIELNKVGATIPQSFADLANPAYKGMITMPNPNNSGTGFLTVAGILQTMGEEKGWALLDGIDKNVAAYEPSGSKPTQLAATGENPIGISLDYRIIQEIHKGSPLKIVFPREKSGWEIEANALVHKDTINPAARQFLDWAIGRQAMQYYGEHYGIIANSAESHPPAEFGPHPHDLMIENNFDWAAENRQHIIDTWTERYGHKK